ncbi:MAG TPA: DUF2267 domain-containing protein [Acidimicrobiales bacterium]|nr:DUF2267 domain-containing protein [Acidimicrobiales bacterium]
MTATRHRAPTLVRRGLAVAGVGLLARHYLGAGTRGRRQLARRGDRMAGRVRHLAGRWEGTSYRLQGRHPDLGVPDNVLADRVRSSLGPLESRLDLPRLHVMVNDRVVVLHGEVETADQALELERAAARVAGVAGVNSFLHVGLTAGDSRPSDGQSVPSPSAALRRLTGAAVAAGAAPEVAGGVVGVVVGVFLERLPEGERDQLAGHLPADVRALAATGTARRNGSRRMRRVGEFMVTVSAMCPGLPLGRTEHVVESVLGVLRSLVPEEAADVAAVLPAQLRALWEGSVPD